MGAFPLHPGHCPQDQLDGVDEKNLENEPFHNIVRELIGLAFLPTDKVMPTLGEITKTSPDEDASKFFEYFMAQWVIRVQPQMWNVRGRVHRTNNDLESWHNRLNLDVGKAKNVFFIIQCLINDHLDAVVLSGKWQAEKPFPWERRRTKRRPMQSNDWKGTWSRREEGEGVLSCSLEFDGEVIPSFSLEQNYLMK